MPLFDLNEIPQTEFIPGFHARFVHSDKMTVANWRIEKDASFPEHEHPHEQIANVINGEFELTVNGVDYLLKPGMVFVIPGGVPHSGRAVSDCHLIDIFYPPRDDYRSKA